MCYFWFSHKLFFHGCICAPRRPTKTISSTWLLIPYSVLNLSSDCLTTMEYRRVSHVWHHQHEIKRKNVINDVKMVISTAVHCPRHCGATELTLCLYGYSSQINGIAEIFNMGKYFKMCQTSFEHEINLLPLVCFRGYGILSTRSIAIPCFAFWPNIVLYCCVDKFLYPCQQMWVYYWAVRLNYQ